MLSRLCKIDSPKQTTSNRLCYCVIRSLFTQCDVLKHFFVGSNLERVPLKKEKQIWQTLKIENANLYMRRIQCGESVNSLVSSKSKIKQRTFYFKKRFGQLSQSGSIHPASNPDWSFHWRLPQTLFRFWNTESRCRLRTCPICSRLTTNLINLKWFASADYYCQYLSNGFALFDGFQQFGRFIALNWME